MVTRHDAEALDAADPLAPFRDQFDLPEGMIYLDGNSLGPPPRTAHKRMDETMRREWGEGLITSWTGADWIGAPQRIGDKIAPLIGAKAGEVIVADSTSINVFKALGAACSLNRGRRKILTERGNFPTDGYMIEGFAGISNGAVAHSSVDPDDLLDALDEDTGVLLLTQVHYKTGRIWDMTETTARAHGAGALVIWDLSHSAGAIEVDLNGAGADFALGCGYKFLNGGPGAPAYLFAATRHQKKAQAVLSGWFGHRRPFDFTHAYEAAETVAKFQCGTPPIISLAALECGVDLMSRVDMKALRQKSMALGELFATLMDERCSAFGFRLVSPRDAKLRGAQISYAHDHGYEIMQALRAADIIGDFRAPDIMRFGMTPLYLRFSDIFDAVERIRDVMASGAWRRPEYAERRRVT